MAFYRNLRPGEIRILCLSPALYGSPLECYLEIVSLDTLTYEQGYEAISYAWGPRYFNHELHIDDIGTTFITKTLYEALQRLRLDPTEEQYRQLWVDAICINQNNTAERSSQVAMMGRIFSSAFNVIIWLGESEVDDTLAFATIGLCGANEVPLEEDMQSLRGSDGIITVNFEGAAEAFLSQTDAKLVANPYCQCCSRAFTPTERTAIDGLRAGKILLRRSWFIRLWPVQEVVLSAEAHIMSGSHWTEWACFSRAMSLLFQFEGDSSESQQNGPPRDGWFETIAAQIQHFESFKLLAAHSKENRVHRRARLLGGILELSERDCYDPRDRVYAIRSIHGIEDSGDFTPDYDTELRSLYQDVCVRYLVDKTWRQPMMPDVSIVLALVGTESTAARDLERPSWVPHMHHLTNRSRAKGRMYDFKSARHHPQFISTSKGMDCLWSPESPHSLKIRGRCFGVVTGILARSECPQGYPEDETRSTMTWSATVLALTQWYIRCSDWVHRYKRAPVAMRKLLCSGDDSSGGHSQSHLGQEAFTTICSSLTLPDSSLSQIWSDLNPFLKYVINERIDRDRLLATFAAADKLCFGWVPKQACIGDEVCIVPGAPWPFILRNCVDGSYRLLGDADVQGVDTFLALDRQESGPQPLPFGMIGGSDSRSRAEAAAEAERYRNQQDPFGGDDPFKSLSPRNYNESATRLDGITESLGWLVLRQVLALPWIAAAVASQELVEAAGSINVCDAAGIEILRYLIENIFDEYP